MSVNSLLDSGNPAESWKALRLASLVIDSDFSLKDDAVKGLSGGIDSLQCVVASNPITGSVMRYDESCDIAPKEITWPLASANITVENDGIYSINVNLVGRYQTTYPANDENINLIFRNVTDNQEIASVSQFVAQLDQNPLTLSLNRIVKLQKDKIYNLIFLQNVGDHIVFDDGGNKDSYVNIIKLF